MTVRAVLLEADEAMLAERRRLGLDKKDEMWEGVLHVVPPPYARHQDLETALVEALRPVARRLGYKLTTDTGVFAADDDYRVPDVVVCRPEVRSARGVDGAPELVVEVRSPGDESYEKLPWYLARGAGAVLIIDRDSLAVELYTAEGKVEPGPDGSVLVDPLGLRFACGDGEVLVDGVATGL